MSHDRRLVKAVEDDPNLPKKKAARALAKFMSLHPHNIEQKTEVMESVRRGQSVNCYWPSDAAYDADDRSAGTVRRKDVVPCLSGH